jgi:hypothetical protein
MPGKRGRPRKIRSPPADATSAAPTDDGFVQSLRTALEKAQVEVSSKGEEDLQHRTRLNKRLIQDLWEVHVQFEGIGVHLAMEPVPTLFATFAEYPSVWTFRESFDFGRVSSLELGDRAPGWLGFTLKFWYYRTPEGEGRFRGIFEWCDGESYHRYAGWMRTMSQAILYDAPEKEVDLDAIHQALRDVVIQWYSAHLEKSADPLIAHLKAKYPAGPTYSKESYR